MKALSTIFTALLICFSGFAFAADATLSGLEGSVLVNAGKDYKKASDGTEVNDGYRVMIMENSKVTIAYENGCEQTIEGSVIYTVDGEACKTGVVAGAVFGNMTAAEAFTMGGIVVGVILIEGDKDEPVSP